MTYTVSSGMLNFRIPYHTTDNNEDDKIVIIIKLLYYSICLVRAYVVV